MKRNIAVAVPLVFLALAACQDASQPIAPADESLGARASAPGQEVAAWFRQASPEVMALPQTVYAAHDEAANVLVFGVENAAAARGVQQALARRRIPGTAVRVQVTEPIHFMNTGLRTEHRPTVGGIQIHWSDYVCTLGFNVTHSGGRSFITNSHCTDNQGTTGNTRYDQPVRDGPSTIIAYEAHDPAYSASLPGCSSGKVCRRSDASRALYESGVSSSQGVIAKTTGVNSGSLTVAGSFTITAQNNTATSYSGTFHKVGRTTGWTSGNVTSTCATVNVSGSNIQLLCQTLVQRRGTRIVQGGDSGSPVFRVVSGDNVELVGILWGGSTNGDLFVFSPLNGIQQELGSVTATFSGGGGPTAPAAPSNLVASAASSSTINLTWVDNATNEDGFKIERCQGSTCTNFSQIATVGANTTSFQSTGLAAGTTYRYRVRAHNAGGDSGYSNIASATTQAGGGSIVLSATGSKVQGRWRAQLSWTPAGSPASVDIRRNGSVIATTNNTGSYTDQTSFVGSGSLTYQVCGAGTSTCSNTVTVNF